MHLYNGLPFDEIELVTTPFPHFAQPDFLGEEIGLELLQWCECCAPWKDNTIPGFYEVSDCNLRHVAVPPLIADLVNEPFLFELRMLIASLFGARIGEQVDVTVHRMLSGQRIGIHTDYGDQARSHRLVIQLNRGWSLSDGGLLMFLNSADANPCSDSYVCYRPVHRSAAAFEISPRSHHAVTRVNNGCRYTLTYSFHRT
jgi:hypothetical protein